MNYVYLVSRTAPGTGFVEDSFSKVGAEVVAVGNGSGGHMSQQAMGSSRRSFACSPSAHLFLTGRGPRGWGPLF